jgi:hypothetical protein
MYDTIQEGGKGKAFTSLSKSKLVSIKATIILLSVVIGLFQLLSIPGLPILCSYSLPMFHAFNPPPQQWGAQSFSSHHDTLETMFESASSGHPSQPEFMRGCREKYHEQGIIQPAPTHCLNHGNLVSACYWLAGSPGGCVTDTSRLKSLLWMKEGSVPSG